MDTYPNLYSDISFGHDDFLIAGLRRISKNRGKFKKLFRDYPGRFFFGTDLVATNYKGKTVSWMGVRYRAYLSMLGTETYETTLLPGESLNGLNLSGEALERILHRNFTEFMAKTPRGTKITRDIDWEQMGVERTGREAGTSVPLDPADTN